MPIIRLPKLGMPPSMIQALTWLLSTAASAQATTPSTFHIACCSRTFASSSTASSCPSCARCFSARAAKEQASSAQHASKVHRVTASTSGLDIPMHAKCSTKHPSHRHAASPSAFACSAVRCPSSAARRAASAAACSHKQQQCRFSKPVRCCPGSVQAEKTSVRLTKRCCSAGTSTAIPLIMTMPLSLVVTPLPPPAAAAGGSAGGTTRLACSR